MWAALLSRSGVSAADAEAIRPLIRRCFAVDRLDAADALARGVSRLGGVPDLPPGLAWPAKDDVHLTFVAQIDLSELASGWVDALPRRGWLWLFLGEDEPAYDVAHVVLHYDGDRDTLAPASPPPSTIAVENFSPRDFVPHRVHWAPKLTLDRHAEERRGLSDAAQLALDALVELVPDSETRIGGAPVSWAHDPRRDAYLLRTGMAPLLFRTHYEVKDLEEQAGDAWGEGKHALGEELNEATELLRAYRAERSMHETRAREWRMLLSIASHREVGMCWWDAGLVQLLVHADDLAAGRFDRTYCEIASS
jgi:hypothetical protein